MKKREKESLPRFRRLPRSLRRMRAFAAARSPENGALRWGVFTLAALACGCVCALLAQLVASGSPAALAEWICGAPGPFDLACLLYALAIFTLGALLGRLWPGVLLAGLSGLLFALANHIKTVINGCPIGIEDFKLMSTLGDVTSVAGELPVPGTFFWSLAILLALTAALALLSPALRLGGRSRFLSFAMAGLLLAGTVLDGGVAGAAAARFGVDMEKRETAELSYAAYGETVGLWRDAHTSGSAAAEQYSESYMDWVLQQIDRLLPAAEGAGDAASLPNVVLLLDEAFFDISTLPGVTYSADPVENFHALASESLTGAFFSGYLGYGTGYVEMGVLSGLNARYFNPGTNVCFLQQENYTKLASLVEQFHSLGFSTASYHTFNNSLYNRTVTFPAMGFDESYYLDDMPDYWTHGAYVADEYLTDTLIDRFAEETADGSRTFLYGISMENHQPYVSTKFTAPSGVTATADGLGAEARQVLQCLTDGVVYADRAVGKLADYFKSQDQPVLLVVYGDHRPNLSVSDTENLYTELGLNNGDDVSRWSLGQLKELYTTDYFVWSNDPALSAQLAGAASDSSYTTLGAKLLSLSGIEMSRYWALVELVSESSLVDSDLYFADGHGDVFWSEADAGVSDDGEKALELLRAVYYDAFYGEQYITKAMNLPAGAR